MMCCYLVALVVVCALGLTTAQYQLAEGFDLMGLTAGSEWLLDDPQKSDRLPVWNQIFSNQRVSRSQSGSSIRSRGKQTSTRTQHRDANFGSATNVNHLMAFLMNSFDF